MKADENAFELCADSGKQDPVAAPFIAFLRYIHLHGNYPEEFISSFPKDKLQLANFWYLDEILLASTEKDKTTSLPGLALPDGLVDRMITELYSLALREASGSVQRYFYLFGHSGGEYAEFMVDQLARLFEQQPDLVLRNWPLIRSYRLQLKEVSEENSPEFSRRMVHTYRALCNEQKDQRCKEILNIFE